MALVLGADWQRELWASPYRLRFELSQGETTLGMFTSSYDRARLLARAALSSDDVVAVVAAFPDPKRELGAKHRGWLKGAALDHLAEMGVSTKSALAAWDGYWWPDEEEDPDVRVWAHRAVRVSWEEADILIWNQVAHDLCVLPQAPVLSKLVDLERGVTVNVYDDRGMDITALNRETVADLYARFDAWLLNHDRARMAEAFRG